MSVVVVLVLLAAAVAAAARYGADSRGAGDPTGRDAAWGAAPHRPHRPGHDVLALRALLGRARRGWRGFVRVHEAIERHTRPEWQTGAQAGRRATVCQKPLGAR